MSAMEHREEIAFAKRRIAKRRFEMEAQGGGEVRRLHIIYFLSRKGRIEHPHLIRVHHLSRSGVRLRDVKRWLSELRGKDMPESYAWSYKRRYKTGFVWQDLVDEDLITPISDNEYVLKGSEIPSTTFDIDLTSFAEKEEDSTHKEPPTTSVEAKTQVFQKPSYNQHTIQEHLQTPMDNMLTKPLLEIEEEESPPFSSETSTQTDEYSLKLEEENHSDTTKEEENPREKCPFYSTFLNKKNKKKINNGRNDFKAEKPRVLPDSSASKSTFSKSRSYSNNNASNMFRNLITCGAVDTDDSGMVLINRRSKKGSNLDMSTYKPSGNKMAEICKGEIVGGSERISRVSWNQQQQQQQNAGRKSWDESNGSKKNKESAMNSQKPVPAPYKPVNGPNCSQCGKTFKPDKLHAHMKSCRGMKALARGAATPANSSSHRRSTDSPPRGSISSQYLINK